MASSAINMFKCVQCQNLPAGDVFVCKENHISCENCSKKRPKCPRCSTEIQLKKENPIEQILKNSKYPCKYAANGCTWKFVATDMESHINECKFRPYECIGKQIGVFDDCDWLGNQDSVFEHLEKDHKIIGNFKYFHESNVLFSDVHDLGNIHLIDAFSKKFMFHYYSDCKTKMVYFLILYFGRREEVNQYYFEFEVKSPDEKDIRKIKFVEKVTADFEDIKMKRKNEQCIALSHKLIKNRYLKNDKIFFRFIIKKEEAPVARERRISTTSEVEENSRSSRADQRNQPRPRMASEPRNPRQQNPRQQNLRQNKQRNGPTNNESIFGIPPPPYAYNPAQFAQQMMPIMPLMTMNVPPPNSDQNPQKKAARRKRY